MSHSVNSATTVPTRFDPADEKVAKRLKLYGLPVEPRQAFDLWVDTCIPDPDFVHWRLATRYVHNRDGQAVVAEIRVFPHVAAHVRPDGSNPHPGEWAASVWGMEAGPFVPHGGMRRSVLKHLPFQAHETFARECAGALSRTASRIPATHELFGVMQAMGAFTPAKRRRSRSGKGRPEEWTHELLADVAIVHDDAVIAEQSVIEAIERTYQISPTAARKAVAKAKAAALLPSRNRGELPRPMSTEHRKAVEAIVRANAPAISAGRKTIRAKTRRRGPR